jgi:ATP-dependent helicase/nuclease subunit A
MPTPGTGFVAAGVREFAVAFRRPSSNGSAKAPTSVEKIGTRIGMTGDPDFADFDSAVPGFLRADHPGLDPDQRRKLLDGLLDRWGIRSAVHPQGVLRASDALRAWVARRLPDGTWHREWPLPSRDYQRSVIRGSSDLILRMTGGLVVIDHKSFPRSVDRTLARCGE